MIQGYKSREYPLLLKFNPEHFLNLLKTFHLKASLFSTEATRSLMNKEFMEEPSHKRNLNDFRKGV